MAVKQRLTPTLFDKLVADLEISGLRDQASENPETSREAMRYYSVPRIERFNESALRATIRRDLAWLLNTTNLGSVQDLEPYPHVQTSVINYGVPDLAGKSLHRRTILHRAREIREAIRRFETRIEPESLVVEPTGGGDAANTIAFQIHGDIVSAANLMPVHFRTQLDAETASVDVSE
ncbi:MAG TPA: type VI secretion system baseplate subunit TssE [Allosphingosinicella sp.]|jgi:type VI secretion system protein ImpF